MEEAEAKRIVEDVLDNDDPHRFVEHVREAVRNKLLEQSLEAMRDDVVARELENHIVARTWLHHPPTDSVLRLTARLVVLSGVGSSFGTSVIRASVAIVEKDGLEVDHIGELVNMAFFKSKTPYISPYTDPVNEVLGHMRDFNSFEWAMIFPTCVDAVAEKVAERLNSI